MLSKQEIQEGTAVILGVCGFVTVSIGTAFFTSGLLGVATIKLGEALKTHQYQLHEAVVEGSSAIGGGIMMSGLGLIIAKSYQRKRLIGDTQTKALLETEESVKPACFNCRYHNPSNQYLACAVHPQLVNTALATDCSDWTVKE